MRGLPDEDFKGGVLNKSPLDGNVILKRQSFEFACDLLFIDNFELLSNLDVHLLYRKGGEADIEQILPGGIEVESIQMLVVFGFEVERVELF